ncbi:unnamed protein product (mitochondrion) [Plasmodiophora brassicae]|uniref:Peptidase S59 domain-containing protein n=1 Tax=Plasmodiophora brassicae TaxID=37360 RepID=A0A3P3Y8Q8_PLABS|nr:unnamed protein product [Plasmodiophora brassicae]
MPLSTPTSSMFGGGGAATAGSRPGTQHTAYASSLETGPNAKGRLVSITAMPAYKEKSFEELRYEDYAMAKGQTPITTASAPGAMTPAATPAPAFGAGASTFGSGFGASATTPAGSGAFGSGGGFGSSSTATTTTQPFGGGAPSPFGQQSAAPSFGFGSSSTTTATTAPSPFGSGGFGTSSATPFGSSTPGRTGFGTSTAPQQPSTPLFGSSSAATPFGASSTQPPAAPAFPSSSSFGFGSTTAPSTQQPSTAFGGGAAGGFGTSTQPSTGLFGAPSSTATQPTSSMFGGGAPSTSTTPGTGLFGAPKPPDSTFSFGGTAPSTSTPAFGSGTPGGGLFSGGATGPSTQPASATPSLFGQTSSTTPSPFGFGGSSTTTPAQPSQPAGGSLFGSSQMPTTGATSGTSSLFGGLGTQQPSTGLGTSSLFGGAKPGTPSMFGTAPAPSTPAPSTTQPFSFQTPAQPQTSLFAPSTPAPSTSTLFGSATPQQQQQQQQLMSQSMQQQATPQHSRITPTIDSNPFGLTPLPEKRPESTTLSFQAPSTPAPASRTGVARPSPTFTGVRPTPQSVARLRGRTRQSAPATPAGWRCHLCSDRICRRASNCLNDRPKRQLHKNNNDSSWPLNPTSLPSPAPQQPTKRTALPSLQALVDAGYSLTPSLDELEAMTSEQLAHVTLQVTRDGYGYARWTDLDIRDWADLDLTKLIVISDKSVRLVGAAKRGVVVCGIGARTPAQTTKAYEERVRKFLAEKGFVLHGLQNGYYSFSCDFTKPSASPNRSGAQFAAAR